MARGRDARKVCMITRMLPLPACRKRLADINSRIDQHTLNSPGMKAARALVADKKDLDRQAVELALAEHDLPTTAQQGRALILGLTSLARLNRKRIKLEKRIAHLEGHQEPES